jgi:hypothetical protein
MAMFCLMWLAYRRTRFKNCKKHFINWNPRQFKRIDLETDMSYLKNEDVSCWRSVLKIDWYEGCRKWLFYHERFTQDPNFYEEFQCWSDNRLKQTVQCIESLCMLRLLNRLLLRNQLSCCYVFNSHRKWGRRILESSLHHEWTQLERDF